MAVDVVKFGPGTITVGAVGSPVDFSCQLINAIVEPDKTKDDDVTVLCGDVVGGAAEYTFTISGSVYQDLNDPAGIVAFSWDNQGTEQPITFTPNTAAEATVTGTVQIDPIPVGSDEPKKNMDADFTWDFVGPAIYTPAVAALATSGVDEDEDTAA